MWLTRWSLKIPAAFTDPLKGATSLSKVVWGYGLLGSILYGLAEFLVDPANQSAMRLYTAGGLIFTVYVIVATYRCADNCASKFWGRMARISSVVSLLLLPLLAYLELTGALDLASMGEL